MLHFFKNEFKYFQICFFTIEKKICRTVYDCEVKIINIRVIEEILVQLSEITVGIRHFVSRIACKVNVGVIAMRSLKCGFVLVDVLSTGASLPLFLSLQQTNEGLERLRVVSDTIYMVRNILVRLIK